ncbi:MAG: hypothetical protein QOF14_3434 [Hyphomicrobiales bacterium]|jgi:hypothetical protein|nr:hypothetical protein [Hyphomicrobiales bacterium]
MSPASEIYSVAALVISALALSVSGLTAWLTLFRRGTVSMTQPTVIFFGPGDSHSDSDATSWKVFLRTLLFSTAKRGRIIESAYVRVACEGIQEDFNIWVYGERNELVRGSGLFVGESGVEANHHFLLPPDAAPFPFVAGKHKLSVFVRLLGDRHERMLFSQVLEISEQEANEIGLQDTGLYFDWMPNKSRYVSHIDRRPRSFWESGGMHKSSDRA